MPIGAIGLPPIVPNITGGVGSLPGPKGPMELMAQAMGMSGQRPDTTTEKMAQIIQLMREVAKQDPRIGGLVSDALKVLVEGPSGGRQSVPGSAPIGGAGAMTSAMSSPLGGAGAGNV